MPPDHSLETPSQLQFTCADGEVTIEAALPLDQADADPAGTTATEFLPRFRMVAYTGNAMRVTGWRHPVVVDLDGMSIPSQRRPIRFAHSAAHGIGHTQRIAVEAGRLVAEGVVSRDTAEAREVVTSGKRGFPWQASIGANVVVAFQRDTSPAEIKGRRRAIQSALFRFAGLRRRSFDPILQRIGFFLALVASWLSSVASVV